MINIYLYMKTIISVCIPLYNVEAYIEACIKSVLDQSFQDFEIIIVNDASLDRSLDKIKPYIDTDSRIKVYNNSQNMGLMWTRREGYKRAKGDYIVFLDSDDTLPPNALLNLYNAMKSSHSDIVCGQIAYITSNGISLNKYPNRLSYGNDALGAIKSTLKWQITHNLCGKIYKRELLQNYKYKTYKNVVNAEDAILFYQILSNVNLITTTPEIVYNYYMYDSSSTNIELGEKALNGIFLWQKHRYDIIKNNYTILLRDLHKSMITYLTSLTPSISSSKQINIYLNNYGVPFEINLFNIIRYANLNVIMKCLLSYYCSNWVKKIRYHRLRKAGVR